MAICCSVSTRAISPRKVSISNWCRRVAARRASALIAGDVQFSAGSPAAAIKRDPQRRAFEGALHHLVDGRLPALEPRTTSRRWLKGQAVSVISRGDTARSRCAIASARHDTCRAITSPMRLGTGTARAPAAIISGAYPAALLDALETRARSLGTDERVPYPAIDLHKDVRQAFSGIATTDALIRQIPIWCCTRCARRSRGSPIQAVPRPGDPDR